MKQARLIHLKPCYVHQTVLQILLSSKRWLDPPVLEQVVEKRYLHQLRYHLDLRSTIPFSNDQKAAAEV